MLQSSEESSRIRSFPSCPRIVAVCLKQVGCPADAMGDPEYQRRQRHRESRTQQKTELRA